jgi:hypothetical protein
MIAGESGSPIKREGWETVISVVDGTASSPQTGKPDAIFRLPPHGEIAKNPLQLRYYERLPWSRLVRKAAAL